MHVPSADFRIQFRTIIDHAITRTNGDPRRFRVVHDFDEFMATDSLHCAGPRELAIAFMTRYFSEYLYSGLQLGLYLGVVRYLSIRSARRDLSDGDLRALKELEQIEYKTETELTHWVDAHFRSIR
jgi:hypothetical protein